MRGEERRALIPQSRRGIALYSVRDALARDPALHPTQPSGFYAVLEAIAEIGYANVEFFSFTPLPTFAQHPDAPGGATVSPAQMKRWLDELGLRACGHYGNVLPATVDASLDVAETLEMPFCGSRDPTGVPGSTQKESWDRAIDDWNACAERAARRGIPLYAHAHWQPWDFLRDCGPRDGAGGFTRSTGIRAIEHWLDNTDPAWVSIQFDTFWAFVAQSLYREHTAADGTVVPSPLDPIATAVRHAERCRVFHAKDGIASTMPPDGYAGGYTWCPFGSGDLPLADLFRAVLARRSPHGTPYLNVEQDNGPGGDAGAGVLADPQKSLRDAATSFRGLASLT